MYEGEGEKTKNRNKGVGEECEVFWWNRIYLKFGVKKVRKICQVGQSLSRGKELN